LLIWLYRAFCVIHRTYAILILVRRKTQFETHLVELLNEVLILLGTMKRCTGLIYRTDVLHIVLMLEVVREVARIHANSSVVANRNNCCRDCIQKVAVMRNCENRTIELF